MKEYCFISFVAPGVTKKAVLTALGKISIDIDGKSFRELAGNYFVRLRSDDERLGALIGYLDALKLDPPWAIRTEVEYDRRDLDAAELLLLQIDRAPNGDTGLGCGTEYDLSRGCQECGTASPQCSPLRINASALPQKSQVAQTLSYEILIHESVATNLRIDLRSDRGLRQVEDRKSGKLLPWWQILPDTYMPPLDSATSGLHCGKQCPKCRRDGYSPDLTKPLRPEYRIDAVLRQNLPSFVYSYEHMGISEIAPKAGRRPYLALPLVFINKKVADMLRKAKVRGIDLIPVRIVE